MATIEKALEIAARAHAGQKDKGGQPYILHPLRVMQRFEGEAAMIVGILHDVIEDTSVTVDDLRQAGFSEGVVAAVLCVTHQHDESPQASAKTQTFTLRSGIPGSPTSLPPAAYVFSEFFAGKR